MRALQAAALTKWAVFGVTLPLLPLGSRVAVALVTGNFAALNFQDLFSDGELLVLATVIPAAGIGDLIFDSRPRLPGEDRLPGALAIAAGLIVVVSAVLLFGLITSENRTRSAALDDARSGLSQQERKLNDALVRAGSLTAKANDLDRRRLILGEEIVRLPRQGSQFQQAQLEIRERYVEQLRTQSQQLLAEAKIATEEVTFARDSATAQLGRATDKVDSGRTQAAGTSIGLFFLSLMVGVACVLLLNRRESPIDGERFESKATAG